MLKFPIWHLDHHLMRTAARTECSELMVVLRSPSGRRCDVPPIHPLDSAWLHALGRRKWLSLIIVLVYAAAH